MSSSLAIGIDPREARGQESLKLEFLTLHGQYVLYVMGYTKKILNKQIKYPKNLRGDKAIKLF